MTFQKFFTDKLESLGMWPEDVATVLDLANTLPDLQNMNGRWYDELEGYPPQVLTGLWLWVRRVAADWAKRTQPQAWWLPMLDDAEPKREEAALEQATESK